MATSSVNEFHPEGKPLHVFRLSSVIFAAPAMICFVLVGIGIFGSYAIAMAGIRQVPSWAFPGYVGASLLIALVSIVSVYIRWNTTLLLVYADRVVAREGFIRRIGHTAALSEIIGANFEQSIDGRMMGYGDIVIETRGVDRIVVRQVADAREAQNIIMALKSDRDSVVRSGG